MFMKIATFHWRVPHASRCMFCSLRVNLAKCKRAPKSSGVWGQSPSNLVVCYSWLHISLSRMLRFLEGLPIFRKYWNLKKNLLNRHQSTINCHKEILNCYTDSLPQFFLLISREWVNKKAFFLNGKFLSNKFVESNHTTRWLYPARMLQKSNSPGSL